MSRSPSTVWVLGTFYVPPSRSEEVATVGIPTLQKWRPRCSGVGWLKAGCRAALRLAPGFETHSGTSVLVASQGGVEGWAAGRGQVSDWEGGVGSRWLWEVEVTVGVCMCSVAAEVVDREGWTGVSQGLHSSQNQETGLRPCECWRGTQAGPTPEAD